MTSTHVEIPSGSPEQAVQDKFAEQQDEDIEQQGNLLFGYRYHKPCINNNEKSLWITLGSTSHTMLASQLLLMQRIQVYLHIKLFMTNLLNNKMIMLRNLYL